MWTNNGRGKLVWIIAAVLEWSSYIVTSQLIKRIVNPSAQLMVILWLWFVFFTFVDLGPDTDDEVLAPYRLLLAGGRYVSNYLIVIVIHPFHSFILRTDTFFSCVWQTLSCKQWQCDMSARAYNPTRKLHRATRSPTTTNTAVSLRTKVIRNNRTRIGTMKLVFKKLLLSVERNLSSLLFNRIFTFKHPMKKQNFR